MTTLTRYILENDGPVPANDKDYWIWHSKRADRTTLSIRLQRSMLAGNVTVSTIFLGIAFGIQDDKPLVFETYVNGGTYNAWIKRYTCMSDAIAGHREIVRRITETSTPKVGFHV